MFTWKKKNLNYNRSTGLKSRPVPVPSLAAIRNTCRERAMIKWQVKNRRILKTEKCVARQSIPIMIDLSEKAFS
jgi:hypothetical protein